MQVSQSLHKSVPDCFHAYRLCERMPAVLCMLLTQKVLLGLESDSQTDRDGTAAGEASLSEILYSNREPAKAMSQQYNSGTVCSKFDPHKLYYCTLLLISIKLSN